MPSASCAATKAKGYPVAFDARAEDRLACALDRIHNLPTRNFTHTKISKERLAARTSRDITLSYKLDYVLWAS